MLDALQRATASALQTPEVQAKLLPVLRSNAEVAAPVLESFGTRGLFFVPPGFCELEGLAAKRYFYERIEPSTPPSAEPDDTPRVSGEASGLRSNA